MFASSFFLIHPVNTEAVTNLVGRADLLSCFFSLLTWFTYIHLRHTKGRKKIYMVLLGVLSLVAGMLCKENAISILGVLLLFDLLNQYKKATSLNHWVRLVQSKLPLFLSLLLSIPMYLIIRKIFLGLDFSTSPIPFIDNPLAHATALVRLGSAFWILLKGWGLFWFPANLSTDYSYNQIPLIESSGDPRLIIIVWVTVIILSLALFTLRKKQIFFSFCIGTYLTLYMMVSNILLPIGTIMGERTLYLPGIAMFTLVGLAWNYLQERFQNVRNMVHYPMAFLVCTVLVFQTHNRNMDYETEEHLWQKQMTVAPESARTWNYNSRFAYQKKDYKQALALLENAMVIYPNWPENHTLKGFILRDMGLAEEAIQAFTMSINLGEKRRFVVDACLQALRKSTTDDRAIIEFLSLVVQRNENLKYKMALLQLLIKDGCHDEASMHLTKWRKKQPTLFPLFSVEISLLNIRAPELVIPTIRAQLRSMKNSPSIRLLLATELLKVGQDDEAHLLLRNLRKGKGLPESMKAKVTHLLNQN